MTLPCWRKSPAIIRTGKREIGALAVIILLFFMFLPQVTAKTVTLSFNADYQIIKTRAKTVGQLLREQGLYVRGHDYLRPREETLITDGLKILLRRALPVFVRADGFSKLVYTLAANTGDLLEELDLPLSAADRVKPALNTTLRHGTFVDITRVMVRRVEEKEIILFSTEQRQDYGMKTGLRRVLVDGRHGKRVKAYEVTFANGEEESRRLLEETIVQKPVNAVVTVGAAKREPVIAAGAGAGAAPEIIEGMASWYGEEFHGQKTAYGYIYDKNSFTAAFPDRDFRGKTLRVTYLKTGRSVNVLVNDYGPQISGRVIDLSMAAAGEIGLKADGVGKVRIETFP